MKAVAGCTHLYRRGAVYWFRRRVPDDVAPTLGLTQWRISLGTKDFDEAKRLVRLRGVETDRQIAVARSRVEGKASLPLTKAVAERAALAWMVDVLDFDEAIRAGDGSESGARWVEESEAQYREDLATLNTAAMEEEVAQTLAREGLWYPPGDPSRTLLGVALLKAQVRLVDIMHRRLAGEVVEVSAPEPVALPGSRQRSQGMTVKQLFAAYSTERFAKAATPELRKKYAHLLDTVETLLGPDKAIKDIEREDIRRVRDVLQRLPKYAGRRYPGLGPSEAADRADEDGAPRISATTVNAYLMDLTTALNWAVKEGKLDKSPATGIMDGAEPSVVRRGFTPDELRRIFAGLQPFAMGPEAWKFWIPAMALYSGARASELATLRVGDLSVQEGIQCMAFSLFDESGRRIEGKSLKTKASERRVPIHDAILSAGFMDYVATLDQTPNTRLFASLGPGPSGNYSHDLSKFFGRFRKRKDVRVDSPSTPFHSFRHGFADACREAGVPDEQRLMLGGWTLNSEAAKYGDRARIRLLARELKKVNYDPFRLPPADPKRDTIQDPTKVDWPASAFDDGGDLPLKRRRSA